MAWDERQTQSLGYIEKKTIRYPTPSHIYPANPRMGQDGHTYSRRPTVRAHCCSSSAKQDCAGAPLSLIHI